MYQRFDYQVRNFKGFCGVKLAKVDDTACLFVKESTNNTGMSVCNAFETLFPLITKHFEIDTSKPFYWVEFWEKDQFGEDEYSLVSHENGKNPKWTYLGNSEKIAINEIRKTLTKTSNVYRSKSDSCLFSDGITREFGENRVINLTDGGSIVACVQPLCVDPNELTLIGKLTK
jgi:hypothetical protein